MLYYLQQASKFPPEVIQNNVELLLECLPYRMKWEPFSRFFKLGGISMLLQLVAIAAEWRPYPGKYVGLITSQFVDEQLSFHYNIYGISELIFYTIRSETIRSALDTLTVCTVTPVAQLQLCEAVRLPENTSTPAIRYV